MKKLVIFDLDGTLLNTIADLAQSTNHALAALGYPTHKEEEYNFMVGNGINKLFERALPEGEKTEENVLRVRKEFVPYYDQHNATRVVLTPALRNFWTNCKPKVCKWPLLQTSTKRLPKNLLPTISPISALPLYSANVKVSM